MSVRTRRLDPLAGRSVPPDYPLFALMLIILSLGLFLVFDASYARASQESGITHGDPAFFFRQQAHWAIIGLVALLAALKLPYWKLSRYGAHALALAVALLLLVLAPHVGHRSHGAVRWLHLGPLQVQPSEIAKICIVIFLAGYLSRRERSIRLVRGGLAGALAPVAVVALLIIKEPDLGTALVLSVTSLVMLGLGGARLKHLAFVAIVGVGLVGVMALSHSYSRHRLLSFVSGTQGDRTYAYQVTQSIDALKAGGIHGRGPGDGDAKFFHLPACYTDFIATTAGEEFGLIGSLVLLGLFLWFTLRGFQIAHRCPNAFGTLLAAGLSTMISVQALLNLAVISRTVPDTGVPLPMMSFGGSSLVLVMFSTGLLLAISRWPDLRHLEALVGVSRRPDQESEDGASTRIQGGPRNVTEWQWQHEERE